MLVPLIAPLAVIKRRKTDPLFSVVLILSGAFGFAWLIAQGFGIGIRGFNFDWLTALFGDLGDRQFGMGYGAMVVASSFLFLLTQGIAARGAINGDVFVVSAIGGVIVIVGTFVFFPIAKMLIFAFVTEDGGYSAECLHRQVLRRPDLGARLPQRRHAAGWRGTRSSSRSSWRRSPPRSGSPSRWS